LHGVLIGGSGKTELGRPATDHDFLGMKVKDEARHAGVAKTFGDTAGAMKVVERQPGLHTAEVQGSQHFQVDFWTCNFRNLILGDPMS